MPKVFTSKTQRIGELGEEIASKYLLSLGYRVVERNYTLSMGEIDIICEKKGTLHFLEIKSVSYLSMNGKVDQEISRETSIRPEENLHVKKIERLVKTVEQYLMAKKVSHETKWQIDLLCVYIDRGKKKAQVKLLEHII